MNLGRMSMFPFLWKVKCLTENFLHLLVSQDHGRMHGCCGLADFGAGVCKTNLNTSGQKKVRRRTESRHYLFRVVDLPDDGFPTRPMSGSRGIVPFKTLRFTSSVLQYRKFGDALKRL